MAAEQEAFVARTGFVHAMASFVQAEGFEQIARKSRDTVGIEFAHYP